MLKIYQKGLEENSAAKIFWFSFHFGIEYSPFFTFSLFLSLLLISYSIDYILGKANKIQVNCNCYLLKSTNLKLQRK